MTRIAVPAIGAVAATAALALVIAAPFALFPSSNETGPTASPPDASGEVTRVTAPPLAPEHKPSAHPDHTAPAPTQPGPTAPPSGADIGAPTDGDAGTVPPSRDGRSPTARPAPPTDDHPGQGKAKGHAKPKHHGHAYGHDKPKHHGHAYGHYKPTHHGQAKGHAKPGGATRLAFTPPRAAKPDHVHPARAGKHSGRGARAHARARR